MISGALAAAFALLTLAGPAVAHGLNSVVFADVTGTDETVRAELGLEYDLLIVSVADTQQNDPLFRAGMAAWEDGDPVEQARVLEEFDDSVVAYVTERFLVSRTGEACEPRRTEPVTIGEREGVAYAFLPLDYTCRTDAGAVEVESRLFPEVEGFVKDTKSVVTYDVDGHAGSAALDAGHPSFSTEQSTWDRFREFFVLGAEHLLLGPDHIAFLLALIVGSRRLREVVLAATTFTVAHSVTFLLAALGVVTVSGAIVEPIIAASIVFVALWHLVRLRREGREAIELHVESRSHFALDREGWIRLSVVFAFGLVHGLGFAGALGIDEPWSWTLLWSLVVFNLGIEAVQLGIIAVLFPLLALTRRKAPTLAIWLTGAVSAGVAAVGLWWLLERVV